MIRRLHAPLLILALLGFPTAPAVPSSDAAVWQAPPRTASLLRGVASWFCAPGRSRCTSGYPWTGAYAAAGPALRVGAWRGRVVTVCASRCVRARLVDWCRCPGRLIDLYGSVFAQLAPLSRGVVQVTVRRVS